MFIQTTITTDITLGTLADISPGDPNSLEEGMTKYLQFRATASLGNDEVSNHGNYSHVTRFLVTWLCKRIVFFVLLLEFENQEQYQYMMLNIYSVLL